jgi:hypothetical protein
VISGPEKRNFRFDKTQEPVTQVFMHETNMTVCKRWPKISSTTTHMTTSVIQFQKVSKYYLHTQNDFANLI